MRKLRTFLCTGSRRFLLVSSQAAPQRCGVASLSVVLATDWHVFLCGNELDLLASSSLGTCLGLLELKARASSLKAKSEQPSRQLLGQWLPPLLPTSPNWWMFQLLISKKITLYLTMHWYPAALNNNLTVGRPSPGARLREQLEGWLARARGCWQTRPCSWWQQPPRRWEQAPGQCWWAPRRALQSSLWA